MTNCRSICKCWVTTAGGSGRGSVPLAPAMCRDPATRAALLMLSDPWLDRGTSCGTSATVQLRPSKTSLSCTANNEIGLLKSNSKRCSAGQLNCSYSQHELGSQKWVPGHVKERFICRLPSLCYLTNSIIAQSRRGLKGLSATGSHYSVNFI